MQLIDLSHTIFDGIKTIKNVPGPIICDFWERESTAKNYSDGSTFQMGKIEMISNTGTYMDCPFHRYADGHDLSGLPLKNCVNLPTIIVDAPYQNGIAVDVSFFKNLDVYKKAVLVRTGWSEFFNTEKYLNNHPFLTKDTALFLKENGATLVGIDSHNIDDTRGGARPVHTILLRENILIVEHLTNMAEIPKGKKIHFSAVPPKIIGMGTFPVRAYVF